MSRRTVASVLVFLLLAVLLAVVAFVPVPYVTMSPGPTINVLGEAKGQPIIAVSGHKTYPTKGELRLTTVSVTNPTRKIGLVEAMKALRDASGAFAPRVECDPPDQSADDVEQQSNGEMVNSQDTAVA